MGGVSDFAVMVVRVLPHFGHGGGVIGGRVDGIKKRITIHMPNTEYL